MTVTVLFPTTGRAEMAVRCLRGLRETTVGHDVQVVAAVDADPDTRDRIADVADVVDYSDEYRGCSRAWNDALALATGDPIVFAADDLVWHDGWLDAALARLEDFEDGWGLVGFNDGHWNEELSTHYLMSRKFIVEVLGGVVAWPEYGHSFNDLETCERARRAGRYAWCEDARVTHKHWNWGTREQDETDRRMLVGYEAAANKYRARLHAGFPINHEPVIIA